MSKRIVFLQVILEAGFFGCGPASLEPAEEPRSNAEEELVVESNQAPQETSSSEPKALMSEAVEEDFEPSWPSDPKPCRGTATEELVRLLSLKAANARSCYLDLLRSGAEVAGRMVVTMHLGSDGELGADPLVTKDEIGDEALASCVLDVMSSGIPEAPPKDGCIVVNVPLNFSFTRKSGESEAEGGAQAP